MPKTPLPPKQMFRANAPAPKAPTGQHVSMARARQPVERLKNDRVAALVEATAEIVAKTIPVRFRITPALAAKIDAAAEAEGVNRSEMIRRALEERF